MTSSLDPKRHRDSISEHAELLDHLREQRGPEAGHEEERSTLGLGIAGLGRRGLPGVHGKEDHEHSGVSSPKSGVSVEVSKAVGGRLRNWTRNTVPDEDLQERIQEIEVEREMEREVLEENKEAEDLRLVQEARGPPRLREEVGGLREEVTVRVVLRQPGCGKVVSLRTFEEVGLLCVLRDTG